MSRSRLSACLSVALIFLAMNCPLAAAAPRTVTSFDAGWRFLKQDAEAAQKPELDDSAWRQLDVPHDWSIEGPAAATNPSGGAGGFFPDGIGWYRKTFSLADGDSAKRIFIHFDSVMANSDVWINGFSLGHRPYGYVPLHYELTGHLNFGAGKTNILAVRVDQSAQPASRYYMGAGIIGHVNLLAVDPIHFEHDSLYVTTPKIDSASALVNVRTTIVNQSDAPKSVRVRVRVKLLDPDGKSVGGDAQSPEAITIAPGKSIDDSQDIPVPSPRLWDLDHPQVYHAQVSLVDGSNSLDDDSTTFGIRTIKFEPATGFALNGKNIRIQGVCLHADVSCFGTAVPASAWERRLAALKPFGVNAIRAAHNPPSPVFLDLCDRMGFLVMDETFDCWDVGKAKFDYHLYFDQWSLIDLRDTVRRDRNHPSVILYSAGNEIHDTPNAEASIRILTGLVKEFHANDPTRPVTQALFRPNTSHDYDDGLSDLLDVVGTNYRMSELLAAQKAKPTRTLVGTEDQLGDVRILAENPPLSGIFIWAGVDYLGESFRFPQISAGAGLLDRTDEGKANAYQVAATWTNKPFVHIVRGAAAARGGGGGRNGRGAAPATTPGGAGDAAGVARGPAGADAGPAGADAPGLDGPPPAQLPGARGGRGPTADWTPANLNPHSEIVTVYSNCPRIELTLNGVAISANPAGRGGANGSHTFSVPFAPGSLKAVGYDDAGKVAATDELRTAGAAAKIVLTADRMKLPNDWDDVSFVRATVTDADGIVVPGANQEIAFAAGGPGVIAAVDSADNQYHEPFQATQRQAYGGICFAVVKSTAGSGTISVTASAPGLSTGTITLEAAPAAR